RRIAARMRPRSERVAAAFARLGEREDLVPRGAARARLEGSGGRFAVATGAAERRGPGERRGRIATLAGPSLEVAQLVVQGRLSRLPQFVGAALVDAGPFEESGQLQGLARAHGLARSGHGRRRLS